MRVVLLLVALAACAGAHAHAPAAAQSRPDPAEPRARAGASIPELLAGLKAKDAAAAGEAMEALWKRGAEAVPFIERFLKEEKGAVYRVRAVLALAEIDASHPAIVPTLLEVAKGRGFFDSEETLMARRQAGMVLAMTPAGIRALPALFKDRDVFVRRSAAFALDDPTEVIGQLTPAQL